MALAILGATKLGKVYQFDGFNEGFIVIYHRVDVPIGTDILALSYDGEIEDQAEVDVKRRLFIVEEGQNLTHIAFDRVDE